MTSFTSVTASFAMMTSATTIKATSSSMLSLGSGADSGAPSSVAVLGGLVVSTVLGCLGLLVVAAYLVVADRGLALVQCLLGRNTNASSRGSLGA